jgi:hypothetical protein
MLARPILIGLLTVLTVPGLHAQQAQAHPSQTLLAPAPLSDEIAALTVTEHSGLGGPPGVQVALQGPHVHDGAKNLLSPRTTQVWLLRKDGTTVGDLSKPIEMIDNSSVRDFGVVTYGMLFTFQAVPPQDLAGVVVSVNGKLLVREIKVNPAS